MRTIKDIYQPVSMTRADVGLGRLQNQFESLYNVDINPDYQRGHVWTEEQRRRYVGFIIQGGQNRPLIINTGPDDNGIGWPGSGKDSDYTFRTELVDGKQRYTSLVMWYNGEIDARLYDGSTVNISELQEHGPSMSVLKNSIRVRLGIVNLDRKSVLEYYLRLNGGGTVHSDEELKRVREMLESES